MPLEPQHKVGPAGARRAERGEDVERRAEHDAIARRNGERLAAEPTVALDVLTRQQSTFTRHDLARFVSWHTEGAKQVGQVMSRVKAAPELVRVGQDGHGRERFSTQEMLATERRTPLALVDVRIGPVVATFAYARLRRQRWEVRLPQDATGGLALLLSPSLERRVVEMVREAAEACPKVTAGLRPTYGCTF